MQLNGYEISNRTLHMLLHYFVKSYCQQKQAINDKLQSSVAIYLGFGGVVNKQGLLLSVYVKKCLKSVNIWQIYKQEHGCIMHFARLANTAKRRHGCRIRKVTMT